MKSKMLIVLTALALAGCWHKEAAADCCITYATSGPCQIASCGCGEGCIYTSGAKTVTIPDLKSAPATLPAYNTDRVLLWTGEKWEIAIRTSTDATGEHWNILTGGYGVSKKRPMWQPLPGDPKDTPLCTGALDGAPKSWKPKGGVCNIEDAGK